MTKWKLVPVEPTPEMIDAWNNDDSDEFRRAYHVMLEAAPQPPKLSDERILEICGFRPESSVEVGADIIRKRWLEIAREIGREILGENK
jgi:hypothetical protein